MQAKELGPAGGRACCFLSSKFYFSELGGTNRQIYLVCFVGDGWVGGLTCDFAGVFEGFIFYGVVVLGTATATVDSLCDDKQKNRQRQRLAGSRLSGDPTTVQRLDHRHPAARPHRRNGLAASLGSLLKVEQPPSSDFAK